ncbi:MAG: hypothetical protein Q9159_000565 [Coniocarpon cinnabarinum]
MSFENMDSSNLVSEIDFLECHRAQCKRGLGRLCEGLRGLEDRTRELRNLLESSRSSLKLQEESIRKREDACVLVLGAARGLMRFPVPF